MIKGVGLDLCQISRMADMLKRPRFLERYFSEEEQAYILSRGKVGPDSAAGIFAAKEAFVKALGTGFAGLEPREIAVLHGEGGAPKYDFRGQALLRLKSTGAESAFLSITHENDMAAAACILEG